MEKQHRAGGPSVWQLAWPAVLSNLLQSSVGVIDIKVVGSLGAPAVAAATAGHRLFFVLMAVLMAASVGSTALIARAVGAGDAAEAGKVVSTSIGLASVIACISGVCGFVFAEPFARMFGLQGASYELAVTYIRWTSVFTPAYGIGLMIGAGLRAAGDTVTPLLYGVLSNLVNIALLYLLVYGHFGFPRLGIAGAAVAGGLAFCVTTLLSYVQWRSRQLRLAPVPGTRFDRERVRRLIRVGYPAALEQLVMQGGFIAFTLIIARSYGTIPLAAYGIGVQILSVSFVVGFGFSIAASTLVGQQLGAGSRDGATHSGWRALGLAVSSMSVLALVIVALARPIAELMIDDASVVELMVRFIYCLGAAQPLMATEHALGGALRGAGDTRFPLLTTFAGLILGRVLLAGIFAWLRLPVVWVYGTLLVDYAIKAVLLIARFRGGRWQSALADNREALQATSAIR